MTICEWCGHEHDVTALCTKRPRWSRRSFLSLVGLGAVGLAVGGVPTLGPDLEAFSTQLVIPANFVGASWMVFEMNERFDMNERTQKWIWEAVTKK